MDLHFPALVRIGLHRSRDDANVTQRALMTQTPRLAGLTRGVERALFLSCAIAIWDENDVNSGEQAAELGRQPARVQTAGEQFQSV